MDTQPLALAIAARRGEDGFFSAQLSAEEWQQLGRVLERCELQAGELLLRRGDVGAHAYLIERGRLQVFVTGEPGRHRIATLHEGTIVGEPGLFGATPRLAHVEAVTPCIVWGMGAQRLQELATEAPGLVLEVLRAAGAVMSHRMRANLERGIPLT